MNPIILSGQEAASNTDILNGTLLQNAPRNGRMLIELQSSDNDATNNYTVSVSLPDGDTPLQETRVPCGNSSGLAGVLDIQTKMMASFAVQQGGRVVISCTETGDAELTWRVSFA